MRLHVTSRSRFWWRWWGGALVVGGALWGGSRVRKTIVFYRDTGVMRATAHCGDAHLGSRAGGAFAEQTTAVGPFLFSLCSFRGAAIRRCAPYVCCR